MKTRIGYVSNSSSTSFLVVYNEISDLDWILAKDKKAHEMVLNDMEPCDEYSVERFFSREAEGLCRRLAKKVAENHIARRKGEADYDVAETEEVKGMISEFCEKTCCDKEEITKLVRKEIEVLHPQRDSLLYFSGATYAFLGREPYDMGKLATQSVCSKWKNAAFLTYWYSDQRLPVAEELLCCDENHNDKSRIF